jgi:hypothetical protein
MRIHLYSNLTFPTSKGTGIIAYCSGMKMWKNQALDFTAVMYHITTVDNFDFKIGLFIHIIL